jgi:glycosyltransferase involved in cell wall biosynthesis
MSTKKPTPSSHNLSIILPAYNEEHNIAQAIEKCVRSAQQLVDDYEVIVVDDGSKDRTGKIVKNLQRQNPRIKIVEHQTNQGYGAAVRDGLLAAKFDLVFFMDADNQFDFAEIKALWPYINQYDLIIGYRMDRQDHLVRKLNAKLWGMLIRLLFGLKVRDIDCAFKIFKRDFLHKITMSSDGAFISSEILIQAKKLGYSIKEVGVHHYPRQEGKATGANPRVICKAFKELFALYRKLK